MAMPPPGLSPPRKASEAMKHLDKTSAYEVHKIATGLLPAMETTALAAVELETEMQKRVPPASLLPGGESKLQEPWVLLSEWVGKGKEK